MSQPFFDQAHQEVQAEANWLEWPDADLETTPAAIHALVHYPAPTSPATVAALVATQAFGLSRLSVNQRH